ncbi:secernin-1-like [Hyposmocoma kahamanoa]|uniref:secernin-1-like n=1 Tax=Hyposmocoma kahamanoa TaxID=1477025 RepID=UPI000E6DA23A|nr:secernin-1-like [Hyposmocoma kahamanoa]XP_026318682.1 secernin-1-like [Hyposmocoma kahamanoa]
MAFQTEFNFTKCFSSGGDELRQREGEKLLKQKSASLAFNVKDMFEILRHKESRICRGCDDTFPTQGSQVSSIDKIASVHWFTATPDPSMSYFKPFVFTPNPQVSPHTESPAEPKREHRLYKLHAESVIKTNNKNLSKIFRDMENEQLAKTSEFMNKYETGQATLEELNNLMHVCVENEIKLY